MEEQTVEENPTNRFAYGDYRFDKDSLENLRDENLSLYITFYGDDGVEKIHRSDLEILHPYLEGLDVNQAIETEYGFILNVKQPQWIRKISDVDLVELFGEDIRVALLSSKVFSKTVGIPDIPWCIRDMELEVCLKRQGINFSHILRHRSLLYVQVLDNVSFCRLREEGINFYDSVVFRPATVINM